MRKQVTASKKFTPNRFKTNRKVHQPRPILKNVDPFPRNSRRTKLQTRNRAPYRTARPARRRSRGRLRARYLPLRRFRRFRRKERKRNRYKGKPYIAPTVMQRRLRSLLYFIRRRNRY